MKSERDFILITNNFRLTSIAVRMSAHLPPHVRRSVQLGYEQLAVVRLGMASFVHLSSNKHFEADAKREATERRKKVNQLHGTGYEIEPRLCVPFVLDFHLFLIDNGAKARKFRCLSSPIIIVPVRRRHSRERTKRPFEKCVLR